MCCRLNIEPLVAEIASTLLLVGKFEKVGEVYLRKLEIEETQVTAILNKEANCLRLEISPPIQMYHQHAMKRLAAGVYFEMACKYAEKVDGRITQTANVTGCAEGTNQRFLGEYPRQPMDFSRVCSGFKETFLGSIA